MNKLLVGMVAAIVLIAALGAYLNVSSAETAHTSVVPADTALFMFM
jgi:hypothetical protein